MQTLRAPSPVQHFLAALDTPDHETFLELAEQSHSMVEVWTLAIVLGYTGSLGEISAWRDELFPGRPDRRIALAAEIKSLEQDLAGLRRELAVAAASVDAPVQLKPEAAYARIAQHSKELRGHLIEIDRMTKSLDRRGLILAGADRVMRELRAIFAGNGEVEDALNAAFRAVWAVLAEEK